MKHESISYRVGRKQTTRAHDVLVGQQGRDSLGQVRGSFTLVTKGEK
jgi:hypothetical protein